MVVSHGLRPTHCSTGISGRSPVNRPTASPRLTDSVAKSPCTRSRQVDSAACPSSVTALATSTPPLFSACHAPSSRPSRLNAANKDRIGAEPRGLESIGRVGAADGKGVTLIVAQTEAPGVLFHKSAALAVGLNGENLSLGPCAQPFQPNRAAARADVPQPAAGCSQQRRQADSPHLALGQLAVVAEGAVGQAEGLVP